MGPRSDPRLPVSAAASAAATPAAPAATLAGEGDPISNIAHLARPRAEGALTAEEFDREKVKLLDEV
jgi:hypothetical protein